MSHSADQNSQSGLIDLHTHTDESDGTLTPEQLVTAAKGAGLSALAITDHDTFAGYEKAVPFAAKLDLDLVQGIELNSRLYLDDGAVRYAHILAFFPFSKPSELFDQWLSSQRDDRRDRNERLIANLVRQGIDITLDEVEAVGRSLTGRPHFARILVEKRYADNHDDAFDRYIGEDAPAFVERQSPSTEEVIQLIRGGGGIPVVAHPIRLSLPHDSTERDVLARLQKAGLLGLEIYHSEHSPALQAYYRELASELELLPSGGSDFHGSVKPDTALGSGRNGNVTVPRQFLEDMRALRIEVN